MNNDEYLIDTVKEDPGQIFKLISNGRFDIIEQLVEDNLINVNLVDSVGNDVVTRLLKAKQYELVFQLMKKKNWDVNHQNVDGDTFGHILANDDSYWAVKVVEHLSKKKNYIPNIKNNKGETIFDRALSNRSLCTALKVLEDKRFNSINISSFKKIFAYVLKNREYGKYTKINTLEIIVENFEKKELETSIKNLVGDISLNLEVIKKDIMDNNLKLIDTLLNNY